MPRRVLVAVNERKPGAVQAAARVERLAREHGLCVGRIAVPLDTLDLDPAQVDLVAVVGGDGTILAAARCFIGTGIPLLGVNAGRVGFMSAFDIDAFDDEAPAVFGDAPLHTRAVRTLKARVLAASTDPVDIAGVNEIVVTAGPPYRMVTLDLSIDGQPGPAVTGDGLIVSTPTGSTAYNVSAGGPILAPGLDAIAVTPIAAHSLAFRPIVVPAAATVEITVARGNDNGDTGTAVVADGQVTQRLATGDRITIAGDGPELLFVVNEDTGYWQTLMRKMRWAAPPATRSDR